MRILVFFFIAISLSACADSGSTAELAPESVAFINLPTATLAPVRDNRATATVTQTSRPTFIPTTSVPPTAIRTQQPIQVADQGLLDTPTPTITPTPAPDALVNDDADGLRLRENPQLDAEIVTQLLGGAPLTVIGRTDNDTWLEVETGSDQTGWVAADYVTLNVPLASVPVTQRTVTIPIVQVTTNSPAVTVTSISENMREIFRRGQSMGNRANVFSKVGDSLTVSTYVLYPIGWGQHQLGNYAGLQGVIDYFSAANARDGNSFANIPLSADNGWTTDSLLDPALSSNGVRSGICQPGETPLDCEYRVVRPAFALILIGTNDLANVSMDRYRDNLHRIVEISMERGVVPVLSTIPARNGFDVNDFNAVIRATANQYRVPLADYYAAMVNAPNQGLSDDGVHPSHAPGEFSASADFRADNLGYGYVIRNLTLLQVLDRLWREVVLAS